MKFEQTLLPGVWLITPRCLGDNRGWFSEVYREDLFRQALGDVHFVQENHSYSSAKGTLRGLHYQRPPHVQGKLVRVIRGAVLDVVVDVRHGSNTFGRHITIELSAENRRQIWIPRGFLHGVCSLTDDVEMIYKVDAPYSATHDAAVAWNDPDIAVDWPIFPQGYVMSDRDKAAPRLRDVELGFSITSP